MPQPHESQEFLDLFSWREKAKNQELEVAECISIWTDICGFGNLLGDSKWDLKILQSSSALELLNEVYTIGCRVLLPNVAPFPSDRIIVLNDGIARTVDFKYKKQIDSYSLLFYFRDLLINHFILSEITKRFKVGIRTVLAGGERIQYSPITVTGQSVLYYDKENISEHGKKLLDTQFLYNPAEFQMNTAFAKAFTIDNLGSRAGIQVNGLFIESDFIKSFSDLNNLEIITTDNIINLYYKNTLIFELHILKALELNIKELDVKVYHISKFFIHEAFDGEDVEYNLFNN
jgi:hypothetical protein